MFNNSASEGPTLWTIILCGVGETPHRCSGVWGQISQRAKLMSRTWWWLGGASFSFAQGCHTGTSDALRGFESAAIDDSGWPDLNTVTSSEPPLLLYSTKTLNFKSFEGHRMNLTLLLLHPLRAWMRNILCGPETVPPDNRRMLLQHPEMGENHREVGSGGLWVRTPTRHFSIKSFFICVQRLLGSIKMWILQCAFQLCWSQSGISKDQHFHEDTAVATWMNGDASALLLLPPWSLPLGCSVLPPLATHTALGAVAATGTFLDSVPKKRQGNRVKKWGRKEKKEMVINCT